MIAAAPPPPRPFYFGPTAAPLLGWFHASRGPLRGAVLLCPTWGDEELGAHRGLRELACRLADAGLAVLRFDLAGEGDAFELPEGADADRWPHWLASVQAAADALKAHSGAPALALVGLRLGALLAAHAAAARDDVTALVGLLPPASGRAWLREARMSGGGMAADGAADGAQVVGGFSLTAATVASLKALAWPEPGPAGATMQALLLERADLPLPETALRSWRSLCRSVDRAPRDDLGEVLAVAHSARLPQAAQAALVQWLIERAPAPGEPARVPVPVERATGPAQPLPPAEASAQGLRESAVQLPPAVEGAVGLVGILSRPGGEPGRRCEPGARGVLLLSSGAERHIGPHRLWVPLARERARRGDTVLRLDLAGLGDSPDRPGDTQADVYDARHAGDVAAAVAWLRREHGVGVVSVVGICSGAYHAWKAALAGAAVQAVVPVNLVAFQWQSGMSLDPTAHAFGQAVIATGALKSARDPQRWLKLLRGRVDVGVVLAALRGHLSGAVASRMRALSRRFGGGAGRPDVGQELLQVGARGTAVQFVFAEGEPGLLLLARELGGRLPALLRDGRLHLSTVDGADHTFLRQAGRRSFYQRLHALLDTIDPAPVRVGVAPVPRLDLP